MLSIIPVLVLAWQEAQSTSNLLKINSIFQEDFVSLYSRAGCEPADPVNTVTQRLNNLLTAGGEGYTLSLCPNQNYPITAALQFTAANQEINTEGLPTDNSRAILTISGPSLQPNQPNHTTAVEGQCAACNGVKLRHIQVFHVLFISVRSLK